MEKIVTRMGDGSRIEMSAAEIQEELETGARDAAERARVPTLNDDEIKYLLDFYRCQIQNCGIAGSGNKLREYVQRQGRNTLVSIV